MREGQTEKRVPEMVFDCAFLGADGEPETVALLVIRDRRTTVLFARVVPREKVSHTIMARNDCSRMSPSLGISR